MFVQNVEFIEIPYILGHQKYFYTVKCYLKKNITFAPYFKHFNFKKMRKILSFVFALVLSIGVNAQTTLTEAVNFSATAHNGEDIDLFEILDGGQYVLIDFFSTSIPQSNEIAPRISDAYYRLGCNNNEVFFIEVSDKDNAEFIDKWIEQYNIEFPIIHSETQGMTGAKINELYGIAHWPTLILIAPDRSIKIQDLWPVSSSQTIIDQLAVFGIEEHDCSGDITPKATINVQREASNEIDVKFVPNVSCESFYYMISESSNLTSEDVKSEGELAEPKEYTHTFEGLNASSKYYVYSLAIGAENTDGEFLSVETRTLCQGGDGVASVELNVNITSTHVVATAIPNEETSEYHFGFARVGYYDESEENRYNFCMYLANDGFPFCDQETYENKIEEIPADVEYYVVAICMNGNAEWSEPNLYKFIVNGESLTEVEAGFNVYPNPANSIINIESSMTGEAQISITDMAGRCVKQVVVSDMSKASINVEDIEKGVYFISVQQDDNFNIQKLVVE